MTAHRLLAPRWLATGGAVLLAGVLGVALLLQNGGSACAAPPSSAEHKGKATFYDLAGTQGNCSTKPPADDLYVALGKSEYSGAAACGSYLDVTGPKGKVRVKVFDSCPECAVGHLDLSRTAFKKIGKEIDGIIPITYRAVPNAPAPGPLSITFVEGTSQYYWAITIDNHSNPIKSVQAKGPGGGLRSAGLKDYNVWIIDGRMGNGPFQVRMTDIYGKTITAKNIKLRPQQKQTTSVRFATGTAAQADANAAPKPAKKATPKPSKPSSSPSASATSVAPPLLDPTEAAPDQTDVALAAAEPAVKAASCG
ncbi:expansin EXLX1 family cellulose-binding protein [Actinoplanes sp. NPDC049599]|uniref:expansin EXLX1 family cellulose-binding protein n=1 Tax=Actinoplanes sp. NPDC049599 TaxID=3363903 RepID=UPI0037BE0ECC